MPLNQPRDVGEIYAQCGHLYVTNQGYVHIHFYTSEELVAEYLVGVLPASYRPHQNVFDVVISKRDSLATACRKLLQYNLSSSKRRELELALSYACALDRAARNGHSLKLKELLRPKEKESIPDLLDGHVEA